MSNRLYVLVRKDLTKSQQAVQACHAVAEFMLYANEEYCGRGCCPPDKYWSNDTIVLLGISSEDELRDWEKFLKDNKYPVGDKFYEPDLPGYTALACYDMDGGLKQAFKKLSLL